LLPNEKDPVTFEYADRVASEHVLPKEALPCQRRVCRLLLSMDKHTEEKDGKREEATSCV
jgi:hypothetical protein